MRLPTPSLQPCNFPTRSFSSQYFQAKPEPNPVNIRLVSPGWERSREQAPSKRHKPSGLVCLAYVFPHCTQRPDRQNLPHRHNLQQHDPRTRTWPDHWSPKDHKRLKFYSYGSDTNMLAFLADFLPGFLYAVVTAKPHVTLAVAGLVGFLIHDEYFAKRATSTTAATPGAKHKGGE